uniref:Uncharacterized protein LOC111135745 n=1 Tax=Crassostrea virginica TaxID=6565 RepID=A0A8B8EPC5_CRAVI|nr:uncharacterized protein LOC111135745 [Crassostrea virginica]
MTNFTAEDVNTAVPTLFPDCGSAGQITTNMMPCENFTQHLPHSANLLAWTRFSLNFSTPTNRFGNFTVNLYFEDNANGTPLSITIKFAVMDSPCHNGGMCQPTSIFPCEDTHRTHSFDDYYQCNCTGGYQGKYCESDINECLSDPCMHPYFCYNKLDHYVCACPEDNPNCEILPWMITIILVIIIIIVILVVIGLRRHKKMKSEKEYMLKNSFGSQSSLGSEFDMGDDILEDMVSLNGSEGFDNPALHIEPHYAPESDRHYFNRHTKSNFTPLLDTDDAITPPPKYDFSEGDHPHPRTIQAMNASKGPLGRLYLTPGTTPFGSSGTESGSRSPALKRHHKVKPVEEDAQSSHSPQDLSSRCNTPDLFTARSSETPSRSATPAFGKHNKVFPDNGKDSPNGSHHSDSNHKGSRRSSPQSLEIIKPTELTISDMDCDTSHSDQSSV